MRFVNIGLREQERMLGDQCLNQLVLRFALIVLFGSALLHELGFAGALSKIGLPSSEIPLALLFFNVGVELGHLIFVFAVLAVTAPLRYGAGISRESAASLKTERVMVYIIGVLASRTCPPSQTTSTRRAAQSHP